MHVHSIQNSPIVHVDESITWPTMTMNAAVHSAAVANFVVVVRIKAYHNELF